MLRVGMNRSPGVFQSELRLDYKRAKLMAAHLVWKPSKRKGTPVANLRFWFGVIHGH
jgi:hypothetical protein